MEEIQIKVVHGSDRDYVDQCLKIAAENHVINGGTLRFGSIVPNSKYVVCAMKESKVVGYAGMVEDFLIEGDFYIYQIAVKKDEAGKGIGSLLVDYVMHHSKGHVAITSNVRKDNPSSNKLHLKYDFSQLDTHTDEYTYMLNTNKIENNEFMKYTEDELELEGE